MSLPRAMLFLFALAALAPPSALNAQPWREQAVTFETGLLWQVGKNTPLSYRLIPNQLTWRSPRKFGRTLESGSQLLVRHRLTMLATAFQQGPESHYIAFTGSPSIEWWNKPGTWCFFGGAGGGFGWLDSQATVGAQGQDFTLNWFMRAGVERVSSRRVTWNAGVMFQHLSNGGQTNPNPGIDAIGLTIGYAWSF
jgi:lipid A 3-O-deacylase